MKYIYLHGFASSPASTKAGYFQTQLRERGIDLIIPELDGGDFENLTLSGQLRVIRETHGSGPAVLMGSSMGGYLAAIYAASHPEVERVVLIAPAFDFVCRFPKVTGEKQFLEWKNSGKIKMFHYGEGRERLLDFGLYEDAQSYPAFPNVAQPALVMHGSGDPIVPVELAERFCAGRPIRELHVFDSGHELTDVLPEIWTLSERFLFRGPDRIPQLAGH